MDLTDFLTGVVIGVVGAVLGGFILESVLPLYRKSFLDYLKVRIIFHLTKRELVSVSTYNEASKRMCDILTKEGSLTFSVMCFSGRDLTTDPLLTSIREFLDDGGTAKFLVMKPDSPFVLRRAQDILQKNEELKKRVEQLKADIGSTLNGIHAEFVGQFPARVEAPRLYDQLPALRMYFIGDTLFLGFYGSKKSYLNVHYLVPSSSKLYRASENIFNETWKTASPWIPP